LSLISISERCQSSHTSYLKVDVLLIPEKFPPLKTEVLLFINTAISEK